MRSKADVSQLNKPQETENEERKIREKLKTNTDMLRKIGEERFSYCSV